MQRLHSTLLALALHGARSADLALSIVDPTRGVDDGLVVGANVDIRVGGLAEGEQVCVTVGGQQFCDTTAELARRGAALETMTPRSSPIAT